MPAALYRRNARKYGTMALARSKHGERYYNRLDASCRLESLGASWHAPGRRGVNASLGIGRAMK